MNLLQAVFLCLVLLVIVMAGTWFYGEARYQRGVLDTEADAAEQVSQQEKIAQEALATVDRLQPKVDSLQSMVDVYALRSDSLGAEVIAAKDAARDADLRADELAERFEDSGDLADCPPALNACQVAREQQSVVIVGLSESLTLKAEQLGLKNQQLAVVTVQRDSARAAADYALAGIDEAQIVIAAKEKQIGSLRTQRNAVGVAGVLATLLALILG